MTRRSFVAGSAVSALRAARVMGANDRIRVGMLGCGRRNLLREVLQHSQEANLEVLAVCDIWRQQREDAAARVKEASGESPDLLHAQEDLFARDDIDAVVIGTPDHQHCLQLIDAVRAKKDVYVEKPLAMDLKELNKATDAVKASDRVVQMGTQVRSFPTSAAARQFVQGGGLGKIIKIEQARNSYQPYWYRYAERRLEQGDTDWKRFLMHRKDRPWDEQQYAGWFGYRDFSQGPHSNLGVHFLDLAHYITASGPPHKAVAMAGSYRWNKDGFDCPDSIECVFEYPEGFMLRYCSTFGVGGGNFLKLWGTRGEMDASRWGEPFKITGKTVEDDDRIADGAEIPEVESPPHMLNFFQCVRSRATPNAPIEAGHAHSVAAILADEAFVRGRSMVYDPVKRAIREG